MIGIQTLPGFPARAGLRSDHWDVWSALLIGALTAYRLWLVVATDLPLFPDEAYYFGFSRDLALGYYSKPPLLALLVRVATGLLGNDPFAMRSVSVLCACGTLAALCMGARRLFDPRTAFYATALFATLPASAFFSRFMSTDAPLLLFWSLGLYWLVRAIQDRRLRSWLICGVCVGLGLQSKYTMGAFGLSALVVLLSVPELRRQLRTSGPYLGMLVAFLIFAPNVIWNLQNGMVAFDHTAELSHVGRVAPDLGRIGGFILEQVVLLGPMAGPLMALTLVLALASPANRDPGARAVTATTAAMGWPLLALVMASAWLGQAHINWALPAYLSLAVLTAAWSIRSRWRLHVLHVAVGLNIALGVVLEQTDALAGAAGIELSYSADPYADTRGWPELAERLQAAATAPEPTRLLFDDRKTMAEMLYYAPARSANALFVAPAGRVSNQYELTVPLQRLATQESFVAVMRHVPRTYLDQNFRSVQHLRDLTVVTHPDRRLRYRLYLVSGRIGQ